MSAASAKGAETLNHPTLLDAVAKHCPPGFKPLEQHVSNKHFEITQKKLTARHGKDNVLFVQGHYQFHATHRRKFVEHYKNGWMVFVKDRPNRRTVKIGDREVEAGAPDWSRECASCGCSPVVPETGKCGPCTWGEWKTANGNW